MVTAKLMGLSPEFDEGRFEPVRNHDVVLGRGGAGAAPSSLFSICSVVVKVGSETVWLIPSKTTASAPFSRAHFSMAFCASSRSLKGWGVAMMRPIVS